MADVWAKAVLLSFVKSTWTGSFSSNSTECDSYKHVLDTSLGRRGEVLFPWLPPTVALWLFLSEYMSLSNTTALYYTFPRRSLWETYCLSDAAAIHRSPHAAPHINTQTHTVALVYTLGLDTYTSLKEWDLSSEKWPAKTHHFTPVFSKQWYYFANSDGMEFITWLEIRK